MSMSKEQKKLVAKMPMMDEKSRSKAMAIAAAQAGVTLVAIQGADREFLVVIGEGVDITNLIKVLRDKVGYTRIVSVRELKESRCEQEQLERGIWNDNQYSSACCTNNTCPIAPVPYSSGFYGYSQYPPVNYAYQVVDDQDPPSCSIM